MNAARGGARNGGRSVRNVLDAIRRIVRAFRVSSRAAEKKAGLSGPQLFVLQKLAEGGRALSLNELAERTLTHQSTVSVEVHKLADRRLIAVSSSSADRRRIELMLTAAGRRAVARAPGAAQDRLIRTLLSMPAGTRRRLALLLNDLVRNTGLADTDPSLFLEEENAPRRRKPKGRNNA